MIAHIVPATSLQATYIEHARTAFHDTLALNTGISPTDAATDLADAWKAAVTSFAAGLAPAFASWAPGVVDAQHTALITTLTGLFVSPAFVAAQQLAAIANAIYAATIALTAVLSNGATINYA